MSVCVFLVSIILTAKLFDGVFLFLFATAVCIDENVDTYGSCFFAYVSVHFDTWETYKNNFFFVKPKFRDTYSVKPPAHRFPAFFACLKFLSMYRCRSVLRLCVETRVTDVDKYNMYSFPI